MQGSAMTKHIAWAASAAFLLGCGEHVRVGELRHETSAIELDGAELTRIDLKMGAGELQVAGGAAKLLEGDFTYNVDRWKPIVEHHSTGVRSDIEISQPSNAGVAAGNTEYRWDIRVNDTILVDLIAKLGAGEARMNLGSLKLRNVEMNIGAGEVDMDLRGKPARSYDVRINGGVGQASVYLPNDVGITATAAGGIGSIDVDGLENRNGRWIRSGQESNPVQVRVDVKGGVGEIRLVAE
jgi:hypothetical protein